MRFGINTWVWAAPLRDADIARLVPQVAAMGFDWIELPLEEPGAFDYARARTLIQQHGLGASVCAVISAERDLLAADEPTRANGAAYIRACIEAAYALGASNIVGPLYAAVGRTWPISDDEREQHLRALVPTLRDLAQYAAEADTVLCIEPLNRFETSFINLAAQGIELIDRVDHPSCQLMLDTFHMNIEESSLGAAITLAGPRLQHLHACENDRGAPGSGHVPWDDVAAALRAIDYSGPVVIESFSSQVAGIARAAAIWRPLARSQDALARDGLTFLRQLLAANDQARER